LAKLLFPTGDEILGGPADAGCGTTDKLARPRTGKTTIGPAFYPLGEHTMKKLLVIALVSLMAASAFAVPMDPDADMMGIYFDADATMNYRADSAGPFDIYFCLTNPSADMIGGIEFGYQLTYDLAAFFRAMETLNNSALQLGTSSDFNGGDYVLGYPAPVPVSASGSNVVVSWNLSTFAPNINMSFDITGPTTVNSHAGWFGPVYLDGALATIPCGYSTVDGTNSATIGLVEAPVATEAASFGSVKSLFR